MKIILSFTKKIVISPTSECVISLAVFLSFHMKSYTRMSRTKPQYKTAKSTSFLSWCRVGVQTSYDQPLALLVSSMLIFTRASRTVQSKFHHLLKFSTREILRKDRCERPYVYPWIYLQPQIRYNVYEEQTNGLRIRESEIKKDFVVRSLVDNWWDPKNSESSHIFSQNVTMTFSLLEFPKPLKNVCLISDSGFPTWGVSFWLIFRFFVMFT